MKLRIGGAGDAVALLAMCDDAVWVSPRSVETSP